MRCRAEQVHCQVCGACPTVLQDFEESNAMKSTPEADAALQELKAYLSSAPTFVAPKPQEPLFLYLAATNQVLSAALVAQREVDEAEVARSRQSQKRIRTAMSTATRATPRTWQGRKWCSTQCTSSAPCYKGLDRGTLVCRS